MKCCNVVFVLSLLVSCFIMHCVESCFELLCIILWIGLFFVVGYVLQILLACLNLRQWLYYVLDD